jgi:SM-20-related protein
VQKIKDSLNRSIYIFDNVSTKAQHQKFYAFVTRSNFNIGFSDNEAIETNNYKYLHSRYSLEAIIESGFKEILEQSEAWELIKDKEVDRATINLSTPSDINFIHTHINTLTAIYYVNLDWKPEWAGETLFYSEDLKDIIYASPYTPGRLIIADGEIPHTIRVQSDSAPHYRFTFAIFFKNKS